MNGRLCPQVEFAPRSAIEARVWGVAQGYGVWRTEWIARKGEDGNSLRRLGVIVSEALARLGALAGDEREAAVELLAAIEAGALQAALTGIESDADRLKEDGRG